MADENDKRPKPEFNEVASRPEKEVTFEADFDDDLQNNIDEPLRGNTAPQLEPKEKTRLTLTPSGSPAPLFGKPRQPEEIQQPKEKIVFISKDKQPASPERQAELLNGSHTYEEKFNGLNVRTWIADKPSEKGIHKGRIAEMVVTTGEKGKETELAHFKDGKWKIRAEMTPERDAISQAVHEYEGENLRAKLEKGEEERTKEREMQKNKKKDRSR